MYVINDDKRDKTYKGEPGKGAVTGNSIKAYTGFEDQEGYIVPLNKSIYSRDFVAYIEKENIINESHLDIVPSKSNK